MADVLQDWIDAALARASQFDAARAVWTTCALLLVAYLYYVVVSSAWLRLLFTWREPLAEALGRARGGKPHDADTGPGKPTAGIDDLPGFKWSGHVPSRYRSYRVIEHLGEGDVSHVSLVESESRRLVLKRSRGSLGDELLRRESRVVWQLSERCDDTPYRHYLPWPIDSLRDGRRHVTVYAWREGYMGAVEIARRFPQGLDGRHLAWMFNRILEVLGHAHQLGWVHGGILPPHLLYHPESHGLQLLGWTHAHRLGAPLEFAPTRYRNWYPGECHARRPATAASDIYLAARCMLWLAGVSDSPDRYPKQIPRPIRQCLESCLSDSPALRPPDAWALHREFTDLLAEAYGPPRFHPLVLS